MYTLKEKISYIMTCELGTKLSVVKDQTFTTLRTVLELNHNKINFKENIFTHDLILSNSKNR